MGTKNNGAAGVQYTPVMPGAVTTHYCPRCGAAHQWAANTRGTAAARVVCNGCGALLQWSADVWLQRLDPREQPPEVQAEYRRALDVLFDAARATAPKE